MTHDWELIMSGSTACFIFLKSWLSGLTLRKVIFICFVAEGQLLAPAIKKLSLLNHDKWFFLLTCKWYHACSSIVKVKFLGCQSGEPVLQNNLTKFIYIVWAKTGLHYVWCHCSFRCHSLTQTITKSQSAHLL